MGAWTAMRAASELLQLVQDSIIANDRIGTSVPSTPSQLPAIALALEDVHESPSSVGGLAGIARISEDEWSERSVVRTSGVLQISLYASSASSLDDLTEAVVGVLGASVAIRRRGFVGFSILAIGAGAEVGIGRSSTAGAFVRTIDCSIVYEELPEVETGPGGPIRSVHVRVQEQFDEDMDITK